MGVSASLGFWMIWPDGTSKSVASPEFGFGVTIRWPSELIQWACGWAMGSPSRWACQGPVDLRAVRTELDHRVARR